MRQIVISAASDSFEIPYQKNAIEQQIYVIVFAEMPSKCNAHTELRVEMKKQKKKQNLHVTAPPNPRMMQFNPHRLLDSLKFHTKKLPLNNTQTYVVVFTKVPT